MRRGISTYNRRQRSFVNLFKRSFNPRNRCGITAVVYKPYTTIYTFIYIRYLARYRTCTGVRSSLIERKHRRTSEVLALRPPSSPLLFCPETSVRRVKRRGSPPRNVSRTPERRNRIGPWPSVFERIRIKVLFFLSLPPPPATVVVDRLTRNFSFNDFILYVYGPSNHLNQTANPNYSAHVFGGGRRFANLKSCKLRSPHVSRKLTNSSIYGFIEKWKLTARSIITRLEIEELEIYNGERLLSGVGFRFFFFFFFRNSTR